MDAEYISVVCYIGLAKVHFSWKKLPNWTRYSIVQRLRSFSKTNRGEMKVWIGEKNDRIMLSPQFMPLFVPADLS